MARKIAGGEAGVPAPPQPASGRTETHNTAAKDALRVTRLDRAVWLAASRRKMASRTSGDIKRGDINRNVAIGLKRSKKGNTTAPPLVVTLTVSGDGLIPVSCTAGAEQFDAE